MPNQRRHSSSSLHGMNARGWVRTLYVKTIELDNRGTFDTPAEDGFSDSNGGPLP